MSIPCDAPGLSRHPRIQREARTVSAMIDIACSQLHQTPRGELCAECADLLEYSWRRLSACPFQEGKTSCAKCPVHCYIPAMRERVRQVMRTAGPLMPTRHPLLALWHVVDGWRKTPVKKKRGGGAR